MPLSKIISESVDLTDNFNFTGTLQQNGAGIGESNVPAFLAQPSSNQAVNSDTTTIVTLGTEKLDTNNSFSSNQFTVPSGKGGKYFLFAQLAFTTGTDFDFLGLKFFKNGSQLNDGSPTANFNQSATQIEFIEDLSVGDYVDIRIYHNRGSSIDIYSGRTWFGGYLLTT